MWQTRPVRRKYPGHAGNPGLFLRRMILILTLCVSVPALFGREPGDDVLSRADLLIADKRYNDALEILIPYARDNPRDFDAAQRRIRKIITARDEYNRTAQELLGEMEKDDPNPQRIIELTSVLNDLDPQRIAETMAFVNRAREVAVFKANMHRLERIFEQGEDQINRGQYAAALGTYAGGLDIYQAEFFSSGYGAAMENRARANISTINGNINGFGNAASALLEAVRTLENMAGQGIDPQNLAAYRNAYNRLGAEMDRFTALRNTYADVEKVFQEDLTQLRRNDPRMADRNFLAFAVRLMDGHSAVSDDGILGLFDNVWKRAVPRARDLLDAKSRSVYSAASGEAAARTYGGIPGRAEILAGYSSFPADLENRWSRYDTGTQKPTVFNQVVPSGEAGNYLKFRALQDSSPYWRSLGQLGTRYNAVQDRDTIALWRTGENADELIRSEQAVGLALRQIRQEAQTLAASIQRETADYRTMESRFPDSGSREYIDGISGAVADLIAAASDMERASLSRRYTIANGVMENRIIAREAEFSQGVQLLQDKRPTRAAALLGRLDTSLESDRQALQNLLNQYNAESAETAGAVQPLRETALAMQSRLEGIRGQERTQAVAARSRSEQAAVLRREGDRLYGEAQAALNRSEFEAANNRILESGNAYSRSLDQEEDEETRNKREVLVLNLGNVIADRQNMWVEGQVNNLRDQISEAYFSGEFEEAERLLTRAQNTWKITQTVEHPDLVRWQMMITAGARSGRTIPPTAPLYAEMSQLLSDARKNYEEGRLIMSTSPAEGRRKFDAATQNIQKVRLVYPMNEQAGLLDLMIERERDPQAFSASYRDKVNSAIARTKGGGDRLAALNDLRNLRTIDPTYPNWDAIIYQAEVDTGQRLRDPLPEDVAFARDVVERARPIIASRDKDQIAVILPQLSEAIRRDRNNQQARNLFTEGTRYTNSGNIILNNEAERLFQQASQAVIQNNRIGALSIINQIYAINSDYRFNSRMITLEQRANSL